MAVPMNLGGGTLEGICQAPLKGLGVDMRQV